MQPRYLAAILILLALALPASLAHAGGVVSVCDEAHLTAALSGGGTVTFTCSGTITLTSTITITADTTIDGSGQAVTLSGGGTVRLFKVNSGVTLTLDKLTIANGANSAIYIGSGAAAVISNSTFTANSAPSGGGAAIFVTGGSLTVTDSTFTGNTGRIGGAIYGTEATLTVTGSRFAGNGTSSTDGGAIYATETTLTVTNSSFESNTGSEGGALMIESGWSTTVTGSTFYNNSATWGGAFDLFTGAFVVIDKCTIYQNRASMAGGGIYLDTASVQLVNSTVWNNLATNQGGGIANNFGSATAVNSTIANNGASAGGGIYYSPSSTSAAELENTIVANSTSGGNCWGPITTYWGVNISYPDATCGGVNRDPLLGALANNGGPTQTMALSPGSPAIDAGNNDVCPTFRVNGVDQRGYARFVDGNGDKVAACDIGAYEYGSTAPPTDIEDRDPPVVTLELAPAEPDGANGWYRSPVTVKPDVTDASPVINLRCALDPAGPPVAYEDLPAGICPFLGGAQVTAEGAHTFYAAAMDVWGNKSAPVSAGFKIDTPPLGLTSLGMTVNREQAYTGSILEYKLKVRNLTPSAQAFAVNDPIPANTEIVRRINYNPAANAVEWSGVVEPWGFRTATVYVRIASGTPGGTAIVNTASIQDDAASSSASATTIVKTLPPYRGHRADVDVNEVVSRGK